MTTKTEPCTAAELMDLAKRVVAAIPNYYQLSNSNRLLLDEIKDAIARGVAREWNWRDHYEEIDKEGNRIINIPCDTRDEHGDLPRLVNTQHSGLMWLTSGKNVIPKKPQPPTLVEPWGETEPLVGGVILDGDNQRLVTMATKLAIYLADDGQITREYAAAHCQFRWAHETEWRPAGKVVSE